MKDKVKTIYTISLEIEDTTIEVDVDIEEYEHYLEATEWLIIKYDLSNIQVIRGCTISEKTPVSDLKRPTVERLDL